MDYVITADDRARFKRCRRQWDFASSHRRHLEPVETREPVLVRALGDALAVYYYPGTWDWPHELTQSLVRKALARTLDDAGATSPLQAGLALLDCYDAWACIVDDFAPVRIDHDVEALVPDPHDPEGGLATADGLGVKYTARVDLLAVDAADEYWVVRHRMVENWSDEKSLILDEAAVAACWAWEQDYIGMTIAGTVHNEIRIDGPLPYPTSRRTPRSRGRAVAQHEGSGGGRSIPQHRRIDARAVPAEVGMSIRQQTAGIVRRTRIRRTREEITGVGRQIGAEALDMIDQPAIYPAPAEHCSACEFRAPCLVLTEGRDAEPMLAAEFRRHVRSDKPRLGQSTWGFGRGAAPPQL